ncbi:unnamed protein product [Prorocentrum cordatum]|uniref:Cytochrome P450 n=1 Tax=Prorocentrum cordatum TaxID=2364126 RepID=A0ABN9R331_9DINO|nr:unnamed protein product [Polarella glacialis]
MRVVATTMILWAWVIPFLMLLLYLAGSEHNPYLLLGIVVFVPLLIVCFLCMPIRCELDPSDNYTGGFIGFTLRDAQFSFSNYTGKLLSFAKAASKKNFRHAYGQWFADQCQDDEDVGVHVGGNTEMIYGWQACKERLETLGERIKAGKVQRERESELPLLVMNNLTWPEAGRFALGFSAKDHAFVRPYLASVFDCGRGRTWTADTLRAEFRAHFSKLQVLGHDPVTRNLTDITNPSQSKAVVTQMCLKVLHKIAFGRAITDADAIELAALQTTQLLPAVCPAMVARSFWIWSIVGGPARDQCAKWIKRYKGLIEQKWPELDSGDDYRVDLLASAFLDAMTQAGGRSVPLAIDLTLGYILSKNRPECLDDVDFREPERIKQFLMECMRFHPPVTVIPTWVPDERKSNGEWKHELICLNRAFPNPDIFSDPDEFKLDRDPACSMAWSNFAYVDGKKEEPDSHGCPGKQLSIGMAVVFIMEYWFAGEWEPHTDDIKFNYYGTKGFKCTKHQPATSFRRQVPERGQ